MSSPLEAMSSSDRSQTPPSLDVPDESLACTSRTSLHPGLKPQSIVVECLKKLRTSKGSRNAFKRLDYNIVKHLKVDYLPLVFNSDIVFEFPPIGSSTRNSQAKCILDMDKQHGGHA
jgi:hypothetical protein